MTTDKFSARLAAQLIAHYMEDVDWDFEHLFSSDEKKLVQSQDNLEDLYKWCIEQDPTLYKEKS